MQLHFLGTTGYHPNNRRHTACLMIPESGLILDAGTGMFRVRDLIRTDHLNVFLSHAHLDHSLGLTFLFDILWEKEVTVDVHCELGKGEALQSHLFSELIFPVMPPFEFHPFMSDPISLPCGGVLKTIPLKHPGGSHGFRIDWPDRSLAYITDTTASLDAEYVSAISSVDLLVHECYFPDGWEERAALTGHSCLTPVLQVAKAAEVGKLAMVHINPLDESDSPIGLQPNNSIFPNVVVPEDNDVIEF